MKKPSWLNKKINLTLGNYTRSLLRKLNLRTVCEESLCPNISECFGQNIATFMILGNICTRRCSFCAVKKGKPFFYEKDEPDRIAKAVSLLNLSYVVITSPTRDDLPDGGASIFIRTVEQIRKKINNIKIELLIPDFLGRKEILEKIANSSADVISHNLETVPSLYSVVRRGADYKRSLEVLKIIKKSSCIKTKSAIMLGLGEKEDEVFGVLEDLRGVKCDFLTLGQYLAPSLKHYPVKEYISLEKFSYLGLKAKKMGFEVRSSPYVRSSYLASSQL